MSIRIKCTCGARLKAPDGSVGKSVRCSVCGNAVFVPGARAGSAVQTANAELEAWIRVVCKCGKVIKSPPEWAGKIGHCPRCGVEQVMPTAEQTNVRGEHEATVIKEQAEGPKPLKSLAKPAAAALRPPPKPQPRPQAEPAGLERDYVAEAEDARNREKHLGGQSLNSSGLIDLTGKEEVLIVDGVPPAIWDAKLAQRAAALKSGTAKQTDHYHSAVTEQDSDGGRRVGGDLLRSPAAILTLGVVILLTACYFLYHQFSEKTSADVWSSVASNVYYFDLDKGTLFEHSDSDPPPIMAPSQTEGTPRGVRAYVFSCGPCTTTGSIFVGYLETFDPKTDAGAHFKRFREILATNGPAADAAAEQNLAQAGRLLSTADGKIWIAANSTGGQRIIEEVAKSCPDGSVPNPCPPFSNK